MIIAAGLRRDMLQLSGRTGYTEADGFVPVQENGPFQLRQNAVEIPAIIVPVGKKRDNPLLLIAIVNQRLLWVSGIIVLALRYVNNKKARLCAFGLGRLEILKFPRSTDG